MQRLFGRELILAVALASSAQMPREAKPLRVPDSASAISIARLAAIRVYGKRNIQYEEPLNASLDDGLWTVAEHYVVPTALENALVKSADASVGSYRSRFARGTGRSSR
jgi:hypothetical protein